MRCGCGGGQRTQDMRMSWITCIAIFPYTKRLSSTYHVSHNCCPTNTVINYILLVILYHYEILVSDNASQCHVG